MHRNPSNPKKMTKKLIKFNKDTYNQAAFKYEKYLNAINDLRSHILSETGIELTIDQIKEGRTLETLKREFLSKHKDNNHLNLSAVKLMELLEVDFTSIIRKIDLLKMHPVKVKPQKEKHSIYADTPEQIERLNVVNTIMKCYEKLGIKSPSDLQINQPLLWSGKYKINPYYIKKA